MITHPAAIDRNLRWREPGNFSVEIIEHVANVIQNSECRIQNSELGMDVEFNPTASCGRLLTAGFLLRAKVLGTEKDVSLKESNP